MSAVVGLDEAPSTATAAQPRLPRRLRAMPAEPPYDDELDLRTGPVGAALDQLSLAFAPSVAPRPEPAVRPALTLVGTTTPRTPAAAVPAAPSKVEAELHALFGPRRTRRADLPDPRERAAAAVRVLLEVLAGDRPARQVAAWVSPSILEQLEQHQIRPAHRQARRCFLRSLHISEPTEGAAEVAAVVSHDASGSARRRAVAMRLEAREGRWTVTAFVAG